MLSQTLLNDESLVIHHHGHLNACDCHEISDAIQTAAGRGYVRIILSLDEVQYLDSATLGTLVNSLKRLRALGGSLKLCGLNETLRKIISLTQLGEFFEIYGMEEDAIAIGNRVHAAGRRRLHESRTER